MSPSSSISVVLAALFMACCGQKGATESSAAPASGDPQKVVVKDGERTEAPRPGSNDPAALDSIKQEKARERNKP